MDMRISGLRRLYAAVVKNENEIHEALRRDLGKSGFESYMCETGMVLDEISYMLKHVHKFAKEKPCGHPYPSSILTAIKSLLLME